MTRGLPLSYATTPASMANNDGAFELAFQVSIDVGEDIPEVRRNVMSVHTLETVTIGAVHKLVGHAPDPSAS